MANPANGNDKVEVLLISEIDFDLKWNSRSNFAEASEGPNGEMGLDGLVASIEKDGQDTPICVRPHPTAGSKKTYMAVYGFRRGEAMRRIAEKRGDRAPTIKAVIRKLSEAGAREANVRENTVRDDLSGADLAFGVQAIRKAYKSEGKSPTQAELAVMVGKSQPYVGKLIKIMDFVTPKSILDHWRTGTARPVTVEDMFDLASKTPPEEQQKVYDVLSRGPETEEGTPKGGVDSWIKNGVKQAEAIGAVLGALLREGAITVEDEESLFINHIALLVPHKKLTGEAKKPATKAEVNKCVKAATKAYNAAYEYVEPEEGAEETKKGKRGDAHAPS